LGILIDALETGNLLDDRPPPGPSNRLHEKFSPLIARLVKRWNERTLGA
jgi:hypothetical protein